MFRYFPNNYVWNLSVDLAIEAGARIGEIEEICAPLLEASKQPGRRGHARLHADLGGDGRQTVQLGGRRQSRGRAISASDKQLRAVVYYLTAERIQAHGSPGRIALYERLLRVFKEGVELGQVNCERVEIPYGNSHLAGLYVRANREADRAPISVQINGLDSTKELKYFVGLPQWLARRGVCSLIVDQPGTGEALRLHDMKALYNSEVWASRVVDYLETRADVDSRRIGLEGVSPGRLLYPRGRLRAAVRDGRGVGRKP